MPLAWALVYLGLRVLTSTFLSGVAISSTLFFCDPLRNGMVKIDKPMNRFLVFVLPILSILSCVQKNKVPEPSSPIVSISQSIEEPPSTGCDSVLNKNKIVTSTNEDRTLNIYVSWKAAIVLIRKNNEALERYATDISHGIKNNDIKKSIKSALSIVGAAVNDQEKIRKMNFPTETVKLYRILYKYYCEEIDLGVELSDYLTNNKTPTANGVQDVLKNNESKSVVPYEIIRKELERIQKQYDLDKVQIKD